jgi:hypothetical protein
MATLDRRVHSSVISMLLRLVENSKRTLRPFIPPRSLIISKYAASAFPIAAYAASAPRIGHEIADADFGVAR